MSDLLLELFSEEIPARMQGQAADDLKRLVTNALVDAGLTYEGAGAFATPRRLALHIAGLPTRTPDLREEKKGPRVGAPDAAVQGFLRAAGLASLDQAKIEKDPKGKGEFYVALIERPGRPTLELLGDILHDVIRAFPWPKSMRWGGTSTRSDSLRWVRPLHAVLCTFGPETEEPDIVDLEVEGIRAGNVTHGHRFMAPGPIRVRRFDDYVLALHQAKVVLDPARRRDIILHDARDLAFAQGLELVEDAGLLDEVAGLVEWPVVLMGEFDEAFLAIPAEVIRATIRANQKCFVLRRGDALANTFILVSNIEARDDGVAIAAGNARVVRARLSDALYFWETDQKPLSDYVNDENRTKPLDQRLAKLRALNIVFHEKLGTQGERVDRIIALAKELALEVGADAALAARAAELCKADLTTEVVGEFPETQGLMGRRYAELQGEDPQVCVALEEHYKPQGPSDRIPVNAVSIAVALADKLDTLVGFWAIDEKPTGSKDPYALRRAALGVIRLVLENNQKIGLKSVLDREFRKQFLHGGKRLWLTLIESGAPDVEREFERQLSRFALHRAYLDQENIFTHYFGVVIATIIEIKQGREDVNPKALIDDKRLKANVEMCFEDDNVYKWPVKTAAEALAGSQELLRRIISIADFSEHNLLREDGSHISDPTWWPSGSDPAKLIPFSIISFLRSYTSDLLSFFHDRLKVYLRDKGARHDLIDAVLALSTPSPRLRGEGRGEGQHESSAVGDSAVPSSAGAAPHPGPLPAETGRGGAAAPVSSNDDLLMIVKRVEALGAFLDTEDGKSLLAGYKRAANILKAEEKKDGAGAFDHRHEPNLRSQHAENILASAVDTAARHAAEFVAKEDFAGAMRALSRLRAPVDAFFTEVTVNDPDPRVRKNRLQLLNELRAAMHTVADFSKVAG